MQEWQRILPGMCAAIFPMPVIGIPMHTTSLGGRDSLYSIVQMPSGIPVATVAINGGANAGLLAAKILATSDEALLAKLKEYSKELKEQVQAKDAKITGSWYIKITKKQQNSGGEELMDYKNAGVDIEAGYKSVELMKKHVQGDHAARGFNRSWRISPVHFPWKNLKTWRNLP